MNDKVKTPFRYPGGKFYALKHILPFVEAIEHQEYREPFVGGGSVFFGKKPAEVNWINDLFHELTVIYKIIQDQKKFVSLKQKLSVEVATKERYAEIKSLHPKNDLEKAFKYYYMNRTSFSGKLISPAWGYREKRSIPPERWHEILDPAHQKLKNTKITSLDFEKVIHAPANVPNVLMYLDPPYFVPPKTKHYINGFTFEDHVRLAQSLKTTNYNFLLSYEDCEEIRDLYSWGHIYHYSFPYRVGDSKTIGGKRFSGKEVIISNRDIKKMKQLQIF